MKNYLRALLLGASLIPLGIVHAANDYADVFVDYSQGSGTSPAFNIPSVALGAPISGVDGSTPYSIVYPAYKNTQIVGVGNGGYLKLGFSTPILNDPVNHAFGMDFTIFGNEFFTPPSAITGSVGHAGLSVWVSQDNVTYYQLAVPNGYGADDWLPTQGSGNPLLPVNPAFTISSFVGLNQAQALSLYNGSAGGASFSLGWAQDSGGNPVNLAAVSYIEIQGTSGAGYVDAIARVQTVPEPGSALFLSAGMGVVLLRRWQRTRPKKRPNPAPFANDPLNS
ncbi:MAG: PEP-CTERM sorting domain-containing protein [Chthoniobacter sp.]|uniref:PEP-CTERM sorting domain-containing protein n=1 Tax=Chthoniobacter sp. TaxID=2510640 RepID=UPI0032A75F52